jgi:hypothetical protein
MQPCQEIFRRLFRNAFAGLRALQGVLQSRRSQDRGKSLQREPRLRTYVGDPLFLYPSPTRGEDSYVAKAEVIYAFLISPDKSGLQFI